MDKIICDLNKTPDLFQRPPQNCPKCGNPVDGQYCQGCALLRKKFKEDLFTYCIENGIFQDFQDTSEPSNNNTNIVNALQEPFVVNQDLGKNSSQSLPQINNHCCYGCGDSLDDIFCHQCTCEFCRKGAHYGHNCPPKVPIIPNLEFFNNQTIDEFPQTVPSFDPTCYSEDGNSFTYDPKSNLVDDSPNVFNPPQTYSYEFYRNDAYYGHDCSLQVLFTYDPEPWISSSDDQSFSNEDISKEIYSNPLFDEEIISMKIDPHHFNVESDLIESMHNQDSSIISSSSKIDSLVDEFAGELTLLKSIPPGINETDCDHEEKNCLYERLLYDNSSLGPPEEFVSENSDVEDDYDFGKDILILEELLSNNSLSLLENESFHFDIPSSSHPHAKPPNGNSGILNVKVMGDIFEQNVLMLTQPTLSPNQEKYPNFLSHQGHEASQPSTECPMMIYRSNTSILDVPLLHFYPLDKLNYGGIRSS
nr:hypothetical protein [Tanacetum cinerariifolium]